MLGVVLVLVWFGNLEMGGVCLFIVCRLWKLLWMLLYRFLMKFVGRFVVIFMFLV